MSLRKAIILLLCFATLYACRTGNSVQDQKLSKSEIKDPLSGSFTISGAYALYPLVTKWSEDFMKINPGIKIFVSTGGTGRGLEDLMSNKSQLAMISRPLTDAELGEGVWTIPVAKDGVAAVVNQKNPYLNKILDQGLSPEELLKVFTSEIPLKWGDLLDAQGNENVFVYKRSDESGAADIFAHFLNKESAELKGTGVIGDDEMIKSIQSNPLAIGFCNFSYAFNIVTGERINGIQIVPADLDYDNKIDTKEIPFNNLEKAHRGLWLGLYPKNLCRELLVGTLGKPNDPAIVEFLKYILSAGQNDVKTSGLCELNDVYVGYSLDKLK